MDRTHLQELLRAAPARLARRWPAAPGAAAALLFVASVALGSGALSPLVSGETGETADTGDGQSVVIVRDDRGVASGEDQAADQTAGDADQTGGDADETVGEPDEDGPDATPSTEPGDGQDQPVAEEPRAEEPVADEPGAEEPRTEEPRAEEPREEQPREDSPREPERTPEPRIEVARLGLSVARRECGVLVDWTRYGGAGFGTYRVVRSTDEAVRWPLGRADVLVGTFESRDRTAMEDCRAPHGKRLFYRVFAVRHTDAGWRILGVSAVRSIVLPREVDVEPTPRPEPGDEPDATPAPEPDATPAPEPEPDPTVEPGPGDGEPDPTPPADGGGEH